MTGLIVEMKVKKASDEQAVEGVIDDAHMTPRTTRLSFIENAADMVAAAVAALGIPSNEGHAGKFLSTDGETNFWQSISALGGKVKQVTRTAVGTESHSLDTELIPLDNTKPEKTEGKEFITHAHTPQSAINRLRVDVQMNLSNSLNVSAIVALFKNADTEALAAAIARGFSAHDRTTVNFSYDMVAGTTDEITFKLRAGCMTGYAGVITMNGSNSAQLLGGAYISSITVTEYTP